MKKVLLILGLVALTFTSCSPKDEVVCGEIRQKGIDRGNHWVAIDGIGTEDRYDVDEIVHQTNSIGDYVCIEI
tara:strand:+ start:420 stop:638 length:219 start_codon:yes stop_codon:yes gene_type:complete